MNTITKNKKGTVLIFSTLILLCSCKSVDRVITSEKASTKLSAKHIIKAHQKNETNFKTLKARVKIDITQNGKQQGVNFTLRMEKDNVIWLNESLLGMVRLMITPNSVKLYNKLNNEYFDGDYKLLSEFAGIDLDFNSVQNMLLGQAIHNLKNETYKVEINNNMYWLQPKNANPLLNVFYFINPSYFKMSRLQLQQQLKKRAFQIDYTAYQEVKTQIVPKTLKIVASEANKELEISMDFKTVSLDQSVRFPFKIPSGFKKISTK